MRVASAFLVASLVTACGVVPDLRFGDEGDAGSVGATDATLAPDTAAGAVDGAASSTGDDASVSSGNDGGIVGTPSDAGGADAPASCPSTPPPGAVCCGVRECRPTGNYCDCLACGSQCDPDEVCCMDHNFKFQKCANSIAACPHP